MATLNTTLAISSTNISSDSMSLSVSDVITVVNPIQGLSRKSIATGSPTELVTTGVVADTYIYIKNTDGTNKVNVKTAAGVPFAALLKGEAMFYLILAGIGVEVQADTGACVVEYATFTKG